MRYTFKLQFLSILLPILFVCMGVKAQPTSDTQEIDGKLFYLHKVEQGHTLYAISKIYQTNVAAIIAANPAAEIGIQIGETLKIPSNPETPQAAWKNPVRIDDGYLIHRVQRRETLYSISKKYNVDINDILELNPPANTGLRRDMELRIPINEIETNYLAATQPAKPDSLLSHFVKPQETLYSISKRYGVTIDEIVNANDGLPEGLKAETKLTIPKLNPAFAAGKGNQPQANTGLSIGGGKIGFGNGTSQTELFADLPNFDRPIKASYNIGVFLPFYLNYLDSARTPRKQSALQGVSLSYLHGLELGLETMKSKGLSAQIFIEDFSDIKRNYEKREYALPEKNYDLVMGPLQRKSLEQVQRDFPTENTHFVVPVPQPNKILLQKNNISKVVPSSVSATECLAKKIVAEHADKNIVLINDSLISDLAEINRARKTINSGLLGNRAAAFGQLKEIGVDYKFIEGLENVLMTTHTNVIVAPIKDKAIVADLFRRLGGLSKTDYKVIVYGMEEWRDYDFITIEARHEFNLHLPTSAYYAYDDPETGEFVKKYREKYGAEPDKYAFSAYDIMLYYGTALLEFGLDFPKNFNQVECDNLLGTCFKYQKLGEGSGFENKSILILEYKDGKLKVTEG